MNHKIISTFLFILIFSFFCSCSSNPGTVISDISDGESPAQEEILADFSPNQNVAEHDEICVSITGAVLNPGVYYLKSSSRVYELINAAGGLLEDADAGSINLVSLLSDGMQIKVNSTKNSSSDASFRQDSPSFASSDLININTAGISELSRLPSIGESRAQAIITYREKNNGFSSLEDIKNVSGIKEGTYEKIKDLICIN